MYLYYYLYYRLYCFSRFTPNKNVAECISFIAISTFLIFNFFTVCGIIREAYPGIVFSFAKAGVILFHILIIVINYNFFIRKQGYIYVIRKFYKESSLAKTISTILSLAYIVGTFYLFFHFV